MDTRQFIAQTMEFSRQWAKGLLEDLRTEPLVRPTDRGGNHALWLAGHIAYSEAHLLDTLILGRGNRFEAWSGLFMQATQPVDDASAYPDLDELLAAWDAVRADALTHLESLSADDLEAPSHSDDPGPVFATVGACYGAMIMHVMHHAGEAADVRRAAGRQPLMS